MPVYKCWLADDMDTSEPERVNGDTVRDAVERFASSCLDQDDWAREEDCVDILVETPGGTLMVFAVQRLHEYVGRLNGDRLAKILRDRERDAADREELGL